MNGGDDDDGVYVGVRMTDERKRLLQEAGREAARRLATPESQAALKAAQEDTRKRLEELERRQREAFLEAWERGNKPRRWWTGR